jgi:hypothetical protein
MKIPVLLFASAALAFSQPVVKNPSFETPDNGGCPEFKYRPYSAPWEFVSAYSGISAIGCNVRFVSPPQPAGLGRQAAFLQSLGEPASIRQTVTGFVPGRTYVMSFFASPSLSAPTKFSMSNPPLKRFSNTPPDRSPPASRTRP